MCGEDMSKRVASVIGYLMIMIVLFVFCCLLFFGLSFKRVVSLTIFISFIAGSLFYWPFRNAFALAEVTLLLIFQVLDIPHLIEFAQLDHPLLN